MGSIRCGLWQIVTTFVYIVTEGSEEKTMLCGCGIPFLALEVFCWVCRTIRATYIRAFYVAYTIKEVEEKSPYPIRKKIRVKRSDVKNFYTLHDYMKDEHNTEKITHYLELATVEHIEYLANIRKIPKNSSFSQTWVNDNLLKK